MLTYKFINTFIDDLFAFVIRMPTMYRIGCFRDDIIFLVYITSVGRTEWIPSESMNMEFPWTIQLVLML
uniref:Uncharacterized protein n=1 Tax=Ditylenchus dipsaci TaxID=166011 RepID=A0A915DBB6_9BILA